MHLTEWDYPTLMATPKTVLWHLLIIADESALKRENEEFMRQAMA